MDGQIVVALIIAAGILALVDEFQAGWKSLTAWAVVLIVVALLIGRFA